MITIPIEFARLIWRMILANSSVREAAKTARVYLIRHAREYSENSGDSPIAKQWA